MAVEAVFSPKKRWKAPLVTVVAGAGYGKTHSVYSFLHKHHTLTTT